MGRCVLPWQQFHCDRIVVGPYVPLQYDGVAMGVSGGVDPADRAQHGGRQPEEVKTATPEKGFCGRDLSQLELEGVRAH